MHDGDMFDGQHDPGYDPLLPGHASFQGPETERGRRRERRYLAVFLAFLAVGTGVLAFAKFSSGNVAGILFAIFAAGLPRFSWSLWNRKTETGR